MGRDDLAIRRSARRLSVLARSRSSCPLGTPARRTPPTCPRADFPTRQRRGAEFVRRYPRERRSSSANGCHGALQGRLTSAQGHTSGGLTRAAVTGHPPSRGRRPSARRGRTRQAPGPGRRGGGSGSVAGMVRRADSDALLMSLRSTVPVGSSAASIRRGNRPNTAFGFRGFFDMRNTPGSQQIAGYPTQGNTGSASR